LFVTLLALPIHDADLEVHSVILRSGTTIDITLLASWLFWFVYASDEMPSTAHLYIFRDDHHRGTTWWATAGYTMMFEFALAIGQRWVCYTRCTNKKQSLRKNSLSQLL